MLDLHPAELWRPIDSDCAHCDARRFPLGRGFLHDVRCCGGRTALYNIYHRARAIVDPEYR